MAGTVSHPIIARSMLAPYGSIPLYKGPEAASLSGGIGTVLISSAGYIDEAAADPTSDIVGLSVKAGANGSAGAVDMEFVPALPGIVFSGVLEDETNNNHVSVATNRYAKYALQRDATNDRWYLDENDTSAVSVRTLEQIDAIGTTKGRFRFVFLASETIYV